MIRDLRRGAIVQVGEVLAGKYRILKRLGEGEQGSVYLAVHVQTEVLVGGQGDPCEEGAGRCCPVP